MKKNPNDLERARTFAQNLFSSSSSNPYGRTLKLTDEQETIVTTKLDVGQSLIVEAGAGTGKTSCFIEFARENPNKKLLYICFNNRAANEAKEKYRREGLHNTTVSTIHGLARNQKSFFESKGKFQTKISVKDIQKKWSSTSSLAWLSLETLKNFCESSDTKINKYHYPQNFVGLGNAPDAHTKIAQALELATKIWQAMTNPEDTFPLSYDHYLKAYQLENTKLPYDYILLDEAQDCNPLALDIVQSQLGHSRVIVIGDSNQAIYGWRGAKNAINSWGQIINEPNVTRHTLTHSFRFGDKIANVANLLLQNYLGRKKTVKGWKKHDHIGEIPSGEKFTLIARTNSTLFKEALYWEKLGKKYHFVATKAEDNWDPRIPYKLEDALDVYRLLKKRRHEIKSPVIRAFENFEELLAAAKGPKEDKKSPQSPQFSSSTTKQGDKELEALCRLVREEKDNLPQVIDRIRKNAASPQEADVFLVTAHRAKGLEWSKVRLAEDFCTLVEKKFNAKTKKEVYHLCDHQNIDPEEINLLYVAITRTQNHLEPNKEVQAMMEILQPPYPYPQTHYQKENSPPKI